MRVVAPSTHLYGPDLGFTSLQSWLPLVLAVRPVPFREITQHYYPTNYSRSKGLCKGTPIPSALELISPEVRDQENAVIQTIVRASEIAHRPTRLSETNTTSSCDASGGPATSPVFASALWSLDWILRSASAGVTGINFHAGEFGLCLPSTFSPICAEGQSAAAKGRVSARPEYYGLWAARQLEGGRFSPVDILNGSVSEDFTAYATVHSHSVITLAVDNFATKGLTMIYLDVSGYHKAYDELLDAPSLNATRRVTFGHASLSKTIDERPNGRRVSLVDGHLQLVLPPASAAIITLRR